jgi:hypothetical protein
MKYNKPSQLKMETVFSDVVINLPDGKKNDCRFYLSDSLRNTLMREDDILKNKLFKRTCQFHQTPC